MESKEAVFENVGQAVHVSFLIMAQEAKQDAPLRAALIRAMESVQLSGRQRCWLDQLRGASSGSINFGGLDGNEVRAQCAMVLQAVKHRLPKTEMWLLQAKYGQTDYEDSLAADSVPGVLPLDAAAREVAICEGSIDCAARAQKQAIQRKDRDAERIHREELLVLRQRLAKLEGELRCLQLQVAKPACALIDNGRPGAARTGMRRRYAFSAERIQAIQSLAEWFRPMFPSLNPFAIDCMLGRLFANHKKLDVTVRDLAKSFGGNHMAYQRATVKMRKHLQELEVMAFSRLMPSLVAHGVVEVF